MESPAPDHMDFDALCALLSWQIELGATEAIGDAPVNAYDLPDAAPVIAALARPGVQKARPEAAHEGRPPLPGPVVPDDPAALARAAVAGVGDLASLRAALEAFEACDLKKGARNTVFSDGVPGARVMVIGEAPGREEDLKGKPYIGPAGQLLDRMFDAIGMGRAATGDAALYITNVMPWRMPGNRDPDPAEIAMMLPFLARHVELARPQVLVLLGNISCQAVLGRKGITQLRGQWSEAFGLPVLPMFHPAYLMRNPGLKKAAWADLLTLRARLRGDG